MTDAARAALIVGCGTLAVLVPPTIGVRGRPLHSLWLLAMIWTLLMAAVHALILRWGEPLHLPDFWRTIVVVTGFAYVAAARRYRTRQKPAHSPYP